MEYNINTDTALVPYIIADRALWNVIELDKRFEGWDGHQIHELVSKNSHELVDKAEKCYAHNEHFRQMINKKRADPRYQLEMYMEHWSRAIVDREYKKYRTQTTA